MKYFQTCSWTRNCTNDFEIETNVHIIDIIDTFLHHLKIVWKENFERNTTWHKRKTTTKQMSSNRPFFCCKQNMVLSISNDQNWKEVSNNVYHVMSIFHRYPKYHVISISTDRKGEILLNEMHQQFPSTPDTCWQ